MSITINPDVAAMQELQSRGVDKSVGVFGSHYVQIGKGNPIRLDVIKSAAVPSAGFKTATKVARGFAGVHQTAVDALKTLSSPKTLDAGALLGTLKAQQTHLERLERLERLDAAQKQDSEGLWMFTKAVESLSNEELSRIFQKFNTPEMDLLQTALLREGQTNKQAGDARMAAARLFNLQALVLKEIGNRAAVSTLNDLRAANPQDESLGEDKIATPQKLSDEYGATSANVARAEHENDITAANMAILAEVSSTNANTRERTAEAENARLAARGLDGVHLKEMGDVLRSAELTINIPIDILVGDTSVIADPTKPLANIWHLNDQGLVPKGEGYLEKRDSVEKVLFPEMAGHDIKADERPVYGALNVQHGYGGGSPVYGNAVIVLKPEVAKRATYTLMDTFLSTAMTVNKERRDNVFALLDGAKGIPDELKTLLKDPESQERKDLDAWFDRLERVNAKIIGDGLGPGHIPGSIKRVLGRSDTNKMADGEKYFLSLLYDCFGDKEAMRSKMVTHDNMEALLPQLGDVSGNALAQAAMKKRSGQTPSFTFNGPEYIEAQIQGQIMPLRDIAEIRVDFGFSPDPAKNAASIAKLKDFERRTGIKVVVREEMDMGSLDHVATLQSEQASFGARHIDKAKLDSLVAKVIEDPARAVREYLDDPNSNRARFDLPPGVKAELKGEALEKGVKVFLEKVQRLSAGGTTSAESIVQCALADALVTPTSRLQEGLSALRELHFDNAAQLNAFVDLLSGTPDIASPREVRLLHRHVGAHAAFLKDAATAQPPLDAQQLLSRLAALAKDADEEFRAMAESSGKKIAGETMTLHMQRISKLAVEMLKKAEPPVAPAALSAALASIDSPEMRALCGQLDAISSWGGKEQVQGAGSVSAILRMLRADTQNIALAAGCAVPSAPRAFAGDLTLVQSRVRDVLRLASPDFHAAFEARFPGYPRFPAPARPDLMPQNAAERRGFLLGVLEPYRQKEISGKERGISVHGRGHIIRAYMFANTMCNILRAQGVSVDKNAVLCGIAGHDLGRAGLGEDIWEKESANATVAALKGARGAEAMGDVYEKELAGCINKQQIEQPGGRKVTVSGSATLEGQLLNAADCLDIGRTKEFDDSYFDFLRGPNGELTEDAVRIRDGLKKEADLLQRLTNPLCANRQKMQSLELQMIEVDEAGGDISGIQAAKDELREKVGATFIYEAQNISNEDYLLKFENVVKKNPQLFPLLSQYAFD